MQTGEVEQVLDEEARAAAEREANTLHADFVNLLHEVLDGSIDSSQFEGPVQRDAWDEQLCSIHS